MTVCDRYGPRRSTGEQFGQVKVRKVKDFDRGLDFVRVVPARIVALRHAVCGWRSLVKVFDGCGLGMDEQAMAVPADGWNLVH